MEHLKVTQRDSSTSLRMTVLTACSYNFQTVVPADNCSHRATFQFPAVKRRIARDRLKLIDVNSPFQSRID